MPTFQVAADQLVLAAEGVVQRGFGDPRPLDDAVDADRVHAFVVEEFVGGGQEPFARRRLGLLIHGPIQPSCSTGLFDYVELVALRIGEGGPPDGGLLNVADGGGT
jgi:hypothetical protein